ncbi:hypothetical protein [Anabaena sp. UHCC 0204]|nr:hypothetical protein [Anabaena sp. UHCC 0204]
MIDSIQERIEVLERCLNNANPEDEKMAEIFELANSRQISFSQVQYEMIKLLYKLNKFIKLAVALKVKKQQNELSLLLFVRYIFLFKEILDQYWDFIFTKHGKEIFTRLITDVMNTENSHNLMQNKAESQFYSLDKQYIFEETSKHLMQSLIKFSLRTKLLSEEEAIAFNKEDNIPQESEAMLISLASTEKWDYVYRKLA